MRSEMVIHSENDRALAGVQTQAVEAGVTTEGEHNSCTCDSNKIGRALRQDLADPQRPRQAGPAASRSVPPEMFLKARRMVTCGKRPLMILTCLCSSLSLGFLVVAVGTDYWLYTAEYVILSNKTDGRRVDVRVEVHSGLWRVCPIIDCRWFRAINLITSGGRTPPPVSDPGLFPARLFDCTCYLRAARSIHTPSISHLAAVADLPLHLSNTFSSCLSLGGKPSRHLAEAIKVDALNWLRSDALPRGAPPLARRGNKATRNHRSDSPYRPQYPTPARTAIPCSLSHRIRVKLPQSWQYSIMQEDKQGRSIDGRIYKTADGDTEKYQSRPMAMPIPTTRKMAFGRTWLRATVGRLLLHRSPSATNTEIPRDGFITSTAVSPSAQLHPPDP
ncbi:Voltage-dependent calcium channel gamma-5 subunit [Branchiostoma belcheri]|nr:Voltage-dependent calcium channel gamma-5 subunit [Branchiostoma belcheri]